MIKLRKYQQTDYDKIQNAMIEHKAVLLSAACGYGKSVLIAHLSNTLNGRVLVLTHRQELLTQNSKLMEDYAILNAKTKKTELLKKAKTVVCMAQTIVRRLEKYGSGYVGNFDTIIIDEAHLDYFSKVYNLLPHYNRIGLTATPIINKNDKKNVGGHEMVRKLSMADEYDVIIQGIGELELIDLGYLVRDVNVMLKPTNLDKLKSSNSNPDGYTSESLNDVFGNNASVKTLYEAYEKYGKGQKTIVFNPTTKTNLATYKYFIERIGEEKVRLFDSVNENNYSREETVEWFKSVDDAVLLNVGVFSVGFDVPELKVILFNKKTKSLQLYLQIAGRGSRPAPNKFSFLFVDMGLNIEEHGRWSMPRVWEDYFKIHSWEKKKITDMLKVWECKNKICGHYNLEGTLYNEELDCMCCELCGTPKEKRKSSKRFIEGDFVMIDEPIYPNANKLINHAIRTGGDGAMVLRMAKSQILDLFKFHTTKDDFLSREMEYAKRTSEIFRPVYFTLLNHLGHNKLKGKNRKLTTELKDIWGKVKDLYI